MFSLAVFNAQAGFFDVKLMMTIARNAFSIKTYMDNNVCTIRVPSRKRPVIVFYVFKKYSFFLLFVYKKILYIVCPTRPTNKCDIFLGKSLIKI